MTITEHLARALMWIAAIFTVVFLMTPLFVTVAVSFGSSSVFTLPPPDWSMRWYERLANTRGPVALAADLAANRSVFDGGRAGVGARSAPSPWCAAASRAAMPSPRS